MGVDMLRARLLGTVCTVFAFDRSVPLLSLFSVGSHDLFLLATPVFDLVLLVLHFLVFVLVHTDRSLAIRPRRLCLLALDIVPRAWRPP